MPSTSNCKHLALLACFFVCTCSVRLTWNVLKSCQGICQVIISHMIMPKL